MTGATDYKIMFPIRCEKCLDEFRNPATVLTEWEQDSFENYAQLKIGHTSLGIQVWCKRHNCNVLTTAVDVVADKKTKTQQVLAQQRGALNAKRDAGSDDLIKYQRVPAPSDCEHCTRHEADKAELGSALTLLYTWASLGQVLPPTIQEPVKRAFRAGVTSIDCKPYEERVKMRDKCMEELEKKKPEPTLRRKLLSTKWRGWNLMQLPEFDELGRPVFRYTSPDGSVVGNCHDAKDCKKHIDRFVARKAH